MSWVPKSGSTIVDRNDEPRSLTEEEIESIVQRLPPFMGADPVNNTVIRNCVLDQLRFQLRESEKICPSGIGELGDAIVAKHYRSLIQPGSTVGSTAAESCGAKLTQTSLNTFHTSGSEKTMATGIAAIKKLLFAPKSSGDYYCTVYFKDKNLSFSEARSKGASLVGVTIDKLVKSVDVNVFDQEQDDYPTWVVLNSMITQRDIPVGVHGYMRIHLDPNALYYYRVTPSKIAQVLNNESPNSAVSCFFSSMSDPMIDVYPHADAIMTALNKAKVHMEPQEAQLYFLNAFVKPDLQNLRVRGVPNITQSYPVDVNVWSIVHTEVKGDRGEQILAPAGFTVWKIYINKRLVATTGISVEKLRSLVESCGMTLTATDNDRMFFIIAESNTRPRETPTEIYNRIYMSQLDKQKASANAALLKTIKTQVYQDDQWQITLSDASTIDALMEILSPMGDISKINDVIFLNINYQSYPRTADKPSEIVQRIYQRDMDAYQRSFLTPGAPHLVTDVMRNYKQMKVECSGQNLKGLFAQPDVDSTMSYCDNVHEMAEVLGIEAARAFLVKQISEVIGADGDININHIMLIADQMCHRGEVQGLSYPAISAQTDYLTMATCAMATKRVQQAAAVGRVADARASTVAICVGRMTTIGTGSVDVVPDDDLKQRLSALQAKKMADPEPKAVVSMDEAEQVRLMNEKLKEAQMIYENETVIYYDPANQPVMASGADKLTALPASKQSTSGVIGFSRGRIISATSAAAAQLVTRIKAMLTSDIFTPMPPVKQTGLGLPQDLKARLQARIKTPLPEPAKVLIPLSDANLRARVTLPTLNVSGITAAVDTSGFSLDFLEPLIGFVFKTAQHVIALPAIDLEVFDRFYTPPPTLQKLHLF